MKLPDPGYAGPGREPVQSNYREVEFSQMNTTSMADPDKPYGSAGSAVHEARGTRIGKATS